MKQLLILTLFLYSLSGFSQHNSNLTFEAGATQKHLKDKLISNKLHKGALFETNIGYTVTSNTNRYHSKFNYANGFYNHLDFPNYDSRSIETLELEIELAYQKQLNLFKDHSYLFWIGAKTQYQYQNMNVLFLGNSNNKSNAQFHGGIYTSIDKKFNFWNQRFATRFNLYLPLLNNIGRPPYTLDSNEKLFANKKTLLIGDFFNLSTETQLSYQLKNNNKIALNYQWNYHSSKLIADLKTAEHTLLLSFIFNLN